MSLEFLLLYVTTVFVASIIPGPSMLLALTHGMKYGARRTVASAAGNVTASLLQAGVSIAGLGAILLASESVFWVVKWVGAVYLVYLGVSMWRSAETNLDLQNGAKRNASISLARMFSQAFLVAAGNPKAIVFFTALFPQFLDPSAAQISQAIVLLTTLAAIAFVCFMIYATGGEKVIAVLSGRRAGKYLNRIIGGTFIGAGVGLAVSKR